MLSRSVLNLKSCHLSMFENSYILFNVVWSSSCIVLVENAYLTLQLVPLHDLGLVMFIRYIDISFMKHVSSVFVNP